MRLLLALLILTLAPLGAQDQPPHEASGDDRSQAKDTLPVDSPETIQAGKDLFVNVCSGCHGPNGEGGRGPGLVPGQGARRLNREQIFQTVKYGMPGTDMPPSPLPDEQLRQITAFVRSLGAPAYEQRVAGDPEAGKVLFFGAAGCAKCHMIRGRGGFLGPDLSNIGASRNLSQLQEGFLQPNARISEGFVPVKVTMRDQRQISGVAKDNTNYSIQILDAEGNLYLLPKQEIEQIVFLEHSWMPADYSQRLSEDEVQNLLAFLSRLAVRIPQPEIEKEK